MSPARETKLRFASYAAITSDPQYSAARILDSRSWRNALLSDLTPYGVPIKITKAGYMTGVVAIDDDGPFQLIGHHGDVEIGDTVTPCRVPSDDPSLLRKKA